MPLAGWRDGDHHSCPDSTCTTYTRWDTRHQLRSAPSQRLLVQATDTVCAYVPTVEGKGRGQEGHRCLGVVAMADADLGPAYHCSFLVSCGACGQKTNLSLVLW